jgi:uncharacterized protein
VSYLEQTEAAGRHVFPDLVRAFALFGIVLVNVAYFAFPGEITYFYGGFETTTDVAAAFTVDALFLLKSYTLFSVMFGAGLAYQMMSAERRGVAFAPRYFRRKLGLLLIGILHVSVAFIGDILIIYAVIGSLLFFFRNMSVRSLKRWAIGILILQVVIAIFFALAFAAWEVSDPNSVAMMAEEMNAAMVSGTDIYQNGSFSDIFARRWYEWTSYIIFAGIIQGPGVLSFFLFGLAGVKSGVLQTPDARLWRQARRIYLPIGFVVSGLGAYIIMTSSGSMSGQGMAGSALITFGAPLSSLGYLGLIAKWAETPMTRTKLFFARAGTSSLTAYLLQSLILSFIFCGYGFGLYAKLGAANCIAIALLTAIVTLSFSSLWRQRFARGPMEALLRRWTYLGAR